MAVRLDDGCELRVPLTRVGAVQSVNRTPPRRCWRMEAGKRSQAICGMSQLRCASTITSRQASNWRPGGSAEVVFDHANSTIRWTVQFHGLSGPVTAAHLHGPAAPGQNAAVVVPLAGAPQATPLRGEARITAEQFGQLASGQWYVNLHTARHPQGEVRGQLRPLASR